MDECEWFVSDCRVRTATELIRNRWDPVVISALRSGPIRRRQLAAGIGDISDKVLAESLRRLRRRGLVRRGGSPATAVYELTDLGVSFAVGPLLAMAQWAVDHQEELDAVEAP